MALGWPIAEMAEEMKKFSGVSNWVQMGLFWGRFERETWKSR